MAWAIAVEGVSVVPHTGSTILRSLRPWLVILITAGKVAVLPLCIACSRMRCLRACLLRAISVSIFAEDCLFIASPTPYVKAVVHANGNTPAGMNSSWQISNGKKSGNDGKIHGIVAVLWIRPSPTFPKDNSDDRAVAWQPKAATAGRQTFE